LLAKVNANESYELVGSFHNSIIQMSDFFHCPAFDFEIAMISVEEAKSDAFNHE